MKFLGVILSLVMCFQISANDQTDNNFETIIDFTGEETKTVTLEGPMTVTRVRVEDQDSTCYRQEPYEEEVCGNETRYRNECRWQPGRRACDTRYDRVCRNVTRYRQRCTTGASRQVCTNEPGRRVCRTRDGRQTCRNVPGRRVCRSEPGRRTCRSVPYTDRVCDRVPRTYCRDIPGRNICQDVPYQDYVCRMVTKYRDIPYACTKPVEVPYEAEVTHTHEVEVKFTDADALGAGKLSLKVVDKEFIDAIFTNENEDQTFVQLTKNTEVVSDEEDAIVSKSEVSVNVGNLQKLLAPVKAVIEGVSIDKKGRLNVSTQEAKSFADSDIELVIVKKKNDEVHFAKTFKASDFSLNGEEGMKIDLSKHGFEKLKTFLGLGGVDLKISMRIMVEPPLNLHLPIKDSLIKNHDFEVEAK